jgi:hypothetical protein
MRHFISFVSTVCKETEIPWHIDEKYQSKVTTSILAQVCTGSTFEIIEFCEHFSLPEHRARNQHPLSGKMQRGCNPIN